MYFKKMLPIRFSVPSYIVLGFLMNGSGYLLMMISYKAFLGVVFSLFHFKHLKRTKNALDLPLSLIDILWYYEEKSTK